VFQFLKNPDFNFMGARNVLMAVSLVLMVASVVVISTRGVNRGIEFRGGTELQIKYMDPPDVADIRSALRAAGVENLQVTSIGAAQENEVYIRIGLSSEEEEEESNLIKRVLGSLRGDEVGLQEATGAADLNRIDTSKLGELLGRFPGLTRDEAEALASAILERRTQTALFHSVDELADLPGMSPEVLDRLRQRTFLGPIALRSQSYIGPAIGKEIVQKALWAVLGSLAGMLVYIWVRFQFQWGLAALVALTHDTLLTLGLFSIFNMNMSLPVVAAFLTLIGYSVNDTVVVFDRIRENLRLRGATQDLSTLVNLSINQTLSRTIITSGLTWIVVMGLFLFGGEALNSFSFVLVVGVVVGTYSSIYIASPILVLWKQMSSRPATGHRAKKVRTPE